MGSFSPKTWNWPSSSWVRVNPRLSLIYTALSPNFPGKCGNPIINLQLWFNGSISPIAFLVKTCVKLRAGWGLLVSAMSHFFKKKHDIMTSKHPKIIWISEVAPLGDYERTHPRDRMVNSDPVISAN